MNDKTANFIADELITLSEMTGQSPFDLIDDFFAFSEMIDCIKKTKGMTEEEATEFVAATWDFPFSN